MALQINKLLSWWPGWVLHSCASVHLGSPVRLQAQILPGLSAPIISSLSKFSVLGMPLSPCHLIMVTSTGVGYGARNHIPCDHMTWIYSRGKEVSRAKARGHRIRGVLLFSLLVSKTAEHMLTGITWILNSYGFPVNNKKNRKYLLSAYCVSDAYLCHGVNLWAKQIKTSFPHWLYILIGETLSNLMMPFQFQSKEKIRQMNSGLRTNELHSTFLSGVAYLWGFISLFHSDCVSARK